MNLLFWNLHKNVENSMEDIIVDLIEERKVDIALFAESGNIAIENISDKLNGFKYYDAPACDKIKIIYHHNTTELEQKKPEYRYIILDVTCGKRFILTGLHLSAMTDGEAKRLDEIQDIIKEISEIEKKLDMDRTIVIGDFNANPFDEELLRHNFFNAVLYKDLIDRSETVTWGRKKYKRFYNPMLNYIAEDTKMYGSFYFHNDNKPLYWYCFDQVLMRKSLISSLKNVEYIKEIKKHSLVTQQGLPDKEHISDHLPLLVEFC